MMVGFYHGHVCIFSSVRLGTLVFSSAKLVLVQSTYGLGYFRMVNFQAPNVTSVNNLLYSSGAVPRIYKICHHRYNAVAT